MKNRIIIIFVSALIILGSAVGFWYYKYKSHALSGAAAIASGPKIDSIPGAGDPSERYVTVQNNENSKKAKEAVHKGQSFVPTITRPSFEGTYDEFDNKNKTMPDLNQIGPHNPSACPIKQVVYKYRPNPANCSLQSLRKARGAGVLLEELLCQSCSCPALRTAGYTTGDFKQVGYSAADLKKCGFSLKALREAGFSAAQLKAAGFSAKELKNAGFSVSELKAAGFSASQLKAAGFGAKALKEAGFSASALKAAGFDLNELKAAGFSGADLKKAGFSAKELKEAGFSAEELKAAGFSSEELKRAGFSPSEINASSSCEAGKLKKLRAQGKTIQELKKLGCGVAALKAAGFTAAELKAAGFSAKELKLAGFSAEALKAAGFSAAELKAAGFSAAKLKAAGFSAAELKAAGFSAAELKAAGFSAAQLKLAGFSAAQLKSAGFSPLELKRAGFSAMELKDAGFSAGELKAAGFDAADLKAAGFSASQLRAAGFSAQDLKNVGFTPEELLQSGFTQGDLLRAGFTPKQAGYEDPEEKNNQLSFGDGKKNSLKNNMNRINRSQAANELQGRAADIPSVSQTDRLTQLRKMEEARMNKRAQANMVQQMQTQMASQAQKLMLGWSNESAQNYVAGEANELEKNVGGVGSASQQQIAGPPLLKAGTVLFATLDTGINTDEQSPILATIVTGPLKGSKLLGEFKRVDKSVLVQFTLINIPRLINTIPIKAVAIDQYSARTALSGSVDSHYLLRYGSLILSSFASGVSKAMLAAKQQNCLIGPCVTYQTPEEKGEGKKGEVPLLSKEEVIYHGLGEVGREYGTNMKSNFTVPPTVKVPGGSGIGVLFMVDLTLPVAAPVAKEEPKK